MLVKLASNVHFQLSCTPWIPGQHRVWVVKHVAQLQRLAIANVLQAIK